MRSGGDSSTTSATPSASAVCVTRVVFFSLAQDQFETLWTRHATAAARVAVSLDKAGATLRVILNHPRAVELFHRHVTAEYSPENYEFWKLVTDFQNSKAAKTDAALVRVL
jgi:hypothetical protein